MVFNSRNVPGNDDPLFQTQKNTETRFGYLVRTEVADTNYTATVRDHHIAYTSLSASRTVTIPAASTFKTGKTLIISDETGTAGANNIIVDPVGLINGAGTYTISTNYGSVCIETNGTNWFILYSR